MEKTIDRKSPPKADQPRAEKIFFIILGLLIAGSVFTAYYRTVIAKDYLIEAQTDCDPYTQKCFVWECDPASEVDGERCTGDTEKDSWYYSLVERNASRIPLCDPKDENCKALICDDNEPDCSYVYCNDETKVVQEVDCSDPVEYTKENPPEDESDSSADEVTCEEGDTICEAQNAESAPADDAKCAPDDAQCQSGATKDETVPADTASPEE